jgi:hypothetical protein
MVDEEGRHVWHAACEDEFKTIIDPGFARFMLEARDHGVCAKCGEDYSGRFRLLAGAKAWISDDGRSWYDTPPTAPFPTGVVYSEFVFLRQVSLWHNDHKVPLWKVRHLEPLRRIEYFKIANMQTLCDACHVVKSRAEEAEKAKMDYQAGEGRKDKPKKKWPSRPMGSKGHEPRVRDINDD